MCKRMKIQQQKLCFNFEASPDIFALQEQPFLLGKKIFKSLAILLLINAVLLQGTNQMREGRFEFFPRNQFFVSHSAKSTLLQIDHKKA